MEPRLGHDFSKVRLHVEGSAHASAAAAGALAYTTGRDVVFGAGQYRPDTVAGRWLLAHELTHVVQQEGRAAGNGGESATLEREASDAGMRVAVGAKAQVSAAQAVPEVQFARVSSGGFGKALEDYTNTHSIDDKAVGLLRKSSTFMGLVRILDGHYVWFSDPVFEVKDGKEKKSILELGPDGGVTKPASAKGKRAMWVTMGGGARFTPFGSAPDFPPCDRIVVDNTDTATFIDEIAHEATHAAASVGGTAPPAKTVADEVKAGIKDEIHARESEAKVLKELPGKDIKEKSQTVATTDPWEVEREVSEGLGATYLENIFFSHELHEAQIAQKLDDTAAGNMRKEIDDLFGSVVLKPSPGYGQIWFEWKTAIRDWEEFNRTHSPEDATYVEEREKLIDKHAKKFIKGKVSYTPLPPKKP